MKKNLIPLLASLSVLLVTIVVAGQINQPVVLKSLSDSSAAKFGEWLYTTLPARPEFLLPLVFVTALLSVAGIAAHHMKEDAWLNEVSDLNTRELKVRTRQAQPRHAAVRTRLIPSRAV